MFGKLDLKRLSDTHTNIFKIYGTSDHFRSVEDHRQDSMNTIANIVIGQKMIRKYFLNCINYMNWGDYVWNTKNFTFIFIINNIFYGMVFGN